jgi:hypothetical protein
MPRLVLLTTCLLAPLACAQLPTTEHFSAPASADRWQFSNGSEYPGATGRLEYVPDRGNAADGALALHFDFSGGGNYVAAIADLPADRPVEAIRLWIHKPMDNLMIVRAEDANGETFQKDLKYHYPGWQAVEIGLDGWFHSWGGDGTFDPPAREFHLLVENQGSARQGHILIDDVELVFNRLPTPDKTAVTTYTESTFDQGWTTSGAPGVKLDDGVWHYRFDDQHETAGLHYGRSVLAAPQELILTVISDGSGHALSARFGSHFQSFERQIGVLDQQGKQVFRVPMGDMSTWPHEGGQDDGIVRYPLRLQNIGLRNTGTTDEGKIEVVSVAFQTRYEKSKPGAVIPTVTRLDDDTVRFDVTVRSLLEEAIDAQIPYTIKSVDRVLKRGQLAVSLGPQGTATLGFDHPFAPEQPVLEAEFTLIADQLNSGAFSTTIARKPEMDSPPQLDPSSRMGVGMYLYRFHQRSDAKQWMQRMCDLAAAAGVHWTREEFHWNWVETAPDQYDFTFFDQLVDTAYENGISIYGLVCYWTAWDPAPPFDDEFVENYCDYLRVLVGRYKDRIKHWEIWNEPNIFFWPGDKDRYAVLLRRAYETIKEVDPEAQVLGISTAGIDTSFINRVLAADAPFDALTIHPYRHDLDVPGFVAELDRAQQLVGGRAVWITEMGWPSNIGGHSERTQAGFVARTYLGGLAAEGVRSVAWYNFREDGTDPFYNEYHFGLVRNQTLTPKMGYAALATVGNLLKGTKRGARVDTPDGFVAYRYETDAEPVIALWAAEQTQLAVVRVTGDDVEILNLAGAPARALRRRGVRILRLERDLPVYFRGANVQLASVQPLVELTVDPPAVHPGEAVTVRWRAGRSMDVTLDTAPHGWTIQEQGDDTLKLSAAGWLPEGERSLPLVVTIGAERFEVPVALRVVPQLIYR